MNDVADRMIELITEHFGVDPKTVLPAARFQADLGADSLDVVALVMAIEDTFGVEISDEDADKIETVQNAIRYVEDRRRS